MMLPKFKIKFVKIFTVMLIIITNKAQDLRHVHKGNIYRMSQPHLERNDRSGINCVPTSHFILS